MNANGPKKKAEKFNKHSTSIAKNVRKKLIKRNCGFLQNPNIDFFFFTSANKEEVTSIIKTIRNIKSTGLSSISTKFLKLFQNTLKI